MFGHFEVTLTENSQYMNPDHGCLEDELKSNAMFKILKISNTEICTAFLESVAGPEKCSRVAICSEQAMHGPCRLICWE